MGVDLGIELKPEPGIRKMETIVRFLKATGEGRFQRLHPEDVAAYFWLVKIERSLHKPEHQELSHAVYRLLLRNPLHDLWIRGLHLSPARLNRYLARRLGLWDPECPSGTIPEEYWPLLIESMGWDEACVPFIQHMYYG